MKIIPGKIPVFFLLAVIVSCAMPPTRPTTTVEFDALKLQQYFDIENSPEEIIEYLNRDGEVVIEATTKDKRKKTVYIKILATPSGPHVSIYPVED